MHHGGAGAPLRALARGAWVHLNGLQAALECPASAGAHLRARVSAGPGSTQEARAPAGLLRGPGPAPVARCATATQRTQSGTPQCAVGRQCPRFMVVQLPVGGLRHTLASRTLASRTSGLLPVGALRGSK